MTLEEKIENLQAASMEEARAQGNAIIQNHKEALEKLYNEHTETALRQAELKLKAETANAKHEVNKAMAKSQIDLKREQGKCQTELKNRLFRRVHVLVDEYMQTEAYTELLSSYIHKAMTFAGGEQVTIYINPTDEDKKAELEERTGAFLTVSREDFIGGIRAVIHAKNILIDHSFKASLAEEYEKFLFLGGKENA